MKQSVILTLHGRVQGVGFRYFVKQKADVFGIEGFVKNEPDGTVHVEAEAEPEQLEHFIIACKQGPPHAWVKKAELQYCSVQHFTGFVRR
jgi:acylphosphatase